MKHTEYCKYCDEMVDELFLLSEDSTIECCQNCADHWDEECDAIEGDARYEMEAGK